MNSKVYKWCAVSQCDNTSVKSPNKLFVYVPHNKTIRNKWLNLARRDPTAICPNSPIYFCEDHFDLPNDMDNYMQYHLMGSVSQVRMKPGCIPTKFACQSDNRKRMLSSHTPEQPCILKKQQKISIEECEKDLEKSMTTKHLELGETSSGSSVLQEKKENITQEEVHKTADKSIQVHMTYKFRSKASQTEIKSVNQMTSPLKPNLRSVSTSPLKVTRHITTKRWASPLPSRKKLFTIEDQSDSDISYTPSVTNSPTTKSVQMKSTSDCSEVMQDDKKQEASKILEYTLRNPRSYIGVPKNCYYVIDLIFN